MSTKGAPFFLSIAMASLVLLAPAGLLAEDGILEKYLVGHGGDQALQQDGVNAFIHDTRLGGGTAQVSLYLDTDNQQNSLHLRAWRQVKPGDVVFALLVFRVEIRGYDTVNRLVYSKNLPGFTFGDSSAGNWQRHLQLPISACNLQITLVGNYE